MRVNWFSPLPPAPAAAARYTRQLLPLLHGHADLTLWTEQADWDRDLEKWATVRQLGADRDALPWEELNRADATIYHLGAGAGPEAWRAAVCRRHPGIVVLHGEADPAALDAALAVVVQEGAAFERLRREDRWPVVAAPAASHGEVLLRLAAEVGSLGGAVLARNLVRQAAAEVGVWMNAAAAAFWLRQVAEEIRNVSIDPS